MKQIAPSVFHGDEFLRRVLASSPDCIKVLDLEGNLLSMTENSQALLGITDLTPHLHTCWTGWWQGEARAEAVRAVEEARRGGTGRFEAFAKTFAGIPKWWDVTISPILGSDGRPEKLLSVSRDVTARHEAEQELAASRAQIAAAAETERDRLAEVFQRSPAFMAVLRGPQHVFELVNDRYRQLIGHRDVLGKTVAEGLPEVAAQGFVALLDGVYASGEPFVGRDVRIRVERQPGQPLEERFLDFVYQPTFDADGSVCGTLVHGVDLTERKAAEAALSRVAEQRRQALDSAQMGWWHLDLLTKQVHMDERFGAIFGFTGGTLSQEQVDAAIHPEDLPKVRAAAEAALRPGDPVPYAMEYRIVHAGGRVRWVQARGQAHFEGDGAARRAVSLVGTVADVTEAKVAQDAVRESEERFRTLFNSINAGFCEIEVLFDEHDQERAVDYRFLTTNPAFREYTGLHDVLGRRIRELVPDHDGHWFEVYGRIALTGEPARFEERAEALGRWYEVYAYRVGDPARRRVAVLFNDVSERRRAETVLRESEEGSASWPTPCPRSSGPAAAATVTSITTTRSGMTTRVWPGTRSATNRGPTCSIPTTCSRSRTCGPPRWLPADPGRWSSASGGPRTAPTAGSWAAPCRSRMPRARSSAGSARTLTSTTARSSWSRTPSSSIPSAPPGGKPSAPAG